MPPNHAEMPFSYSAGGLLPRGCNCFSSCWKSELAPAKRIPYADHEFEQDESLPKWRGWHAARRGLGTNLYRLGVPEKTIQAILRHANVSTTATYYIKTAAADTQAAMAKLETELIGQQTGNGEESSLEHLDSETTPN